MKRILLALLGVAMLAGLASSAFAAAALTQNWTITVSVSGDPVDLQGGGTVGLTFGVVAVAGNTVSNQAGGNPRCTVNNAGYASLDYTVLANVTNWTLGTTLAGATGPANNQAVLAGLFTAAVTATEAAFPAGRDLTVADFGNEDTLGAAAKTATTDILGRNNALPGAADADIVKGFNVAPTASTRSLRFLFEAPTTVSGAGIGSQTITVTIGAANVH
jgi:hypothetical protein